MEVIKHVVRSTFCVYVFFCILVYRLQESHGASINSSEMVHICNVGLCNLFCSFIT